MGDVGSAVESYERAANHYSDQGLANNAIALCNKILRCAPGRTSVYLQLAKLLMQRGFTAEVKRHLVEYWDRMARADEAGTAFEALEDFVDLYSARPEVFVIVAELFMKGERVDEARALLAKAYDDVVRRGDEQARRARLEEIQAVDPSFSTESDAHAVSGEADDSGIVFISPDDPDDLDISLASVELEVLPPGDSALDVETTRTAEMPAIILPDEDALPLEYDEQAVASTRSAPDPSEAEALAGNNPADATEEALADDAATDEEPLAADVAAIESDSAPPDVLGEGSESASQPDDAPARDVPPHIARLESKVAESPDVLEIHRELAEALLEYGDRARGLEELDIVLLGCEEVEDWHKAQAIVEEILRVDPNSVVHHRKRVTYVERNGLALEPGSFERGRWVTELVRANLDLGDALVRQESIDEARAVYQRVLKYDTRNSRAETALEALGFAAAGAADGLRERSREKVTGDQRGAGVAVDAGPGGGGAADSPDVVTEFEVRLDSTMSEEDSQAHYDLGVAFKEMGLVDEAISEFQKALGGKHGKQQAAEALGRCFFEKGQFSVAATILKRAAESDSPDDTTKLGVLYWLGRCWQEQGETDSARDVYQRVSAVDASFEDVQERVQNLPGVGS